MFASFHYKDTTPSCSGMLNTCASGVLFCSTVYFSILGDIPSTPGDLFSFILLILVATTYGVTTNCPNLSHSGPLHFASGTGNICGDFNIDLMKYETYNGTKRCLDFMYGLGLHPLIDRPSRITTHSCTLIDNICTKQINYSIRSGLLINDITDHLPIFALCNYELENKKVSQ